jgi:hypothetical protein
MSDATPRLALPLIAAGQAQKHVTHNEALLDLDALIHLHVEAKGLTAPPPAPVEGARYLVGSSPSGVFTGQADRLAIFEEGGWRFLTPRRGWIASVGTSSVVEIFDGTLWRPAFDMTTAVLPMLGVNSTPDANNPVSLRVNRVLAMARPVAESGDGDIRLTLSKEAVTRTASLIFQTNFSGRAEFGLTGSDAFAVRVSPNGQVWRTALSVDPLSAEAVFPMGLSAGHRSENLLINGDFAIRQRGGVLGSLPANVMAFDRWRTGAGGATVTQSGQTVTLSAGLIQQMVEPSVFGLASLAGLTMTVSVQSLTGADLQVSVGGQTATILRTASPLGATVTLPPTATGPVLVTLAAQGGAASFRQVRLEPGEHATGWRARPLAQEIALCRRYFRKSHPSTTAPGQPATAAPGTVSTAAGFYCFSERFDPPMRVSPTVTVFNPASGAAGSWRTGAGSSVTPTIEVSDSALAILGSGAESGTRVHGHFTAEAEF